MSDTIDREKLEDTNNESKDTAPEESEAAAAEMPADPLEPAKQEGVEESAAEEPETAEQFPRIAPEDLPSQTIKDIPYVEDDLPTLEDDAPLDKGKLYNYVSRMDDKQFRRAQIIFGVVLGALAAICIIVPSPGEDAASASMWNFVIALLIVTWLPRYIERKIEQRLPVAQKWMLIVFAVGMVASIGIGALQGNFSQTVSASPSPSPEVSATPAPSVTPAP